MTAGDDFQTKTDNFVNFLTANGVVISPKIMVADLRAQNQGRGVMAVEDIKQDEVLFTLPKTAILNNETCSLFQNLRKTLSAENSTTIDDILEKYSQWGILILCIFYETDVIPLLDGPKTSHWQPYFDVLPDTFNTLTFWSPEELQRLEPSLIVQRVGHAESEEMYHNLLENGLSDVGLGEDRFKRLFTLEKFHKIASLIQSYSFDVERELYSEETEENNNNENGEDEDEVEIEQEPIKAMVCLADTLNADTHLVNANLTYENGQLAMKATRRIRKGGQVYNTYGEHPNAEILRCYGYVEWGTSKHDFGEVPLLVLKDTFVEKYGVDVAIINEIISIVSRDREFNENFAGEEEQIKGEPMEDTEVFNSNEEKQNDIISDSYECFIDGEVTPEFYFIIQLLTSILTIETGAQYTHKFTQLTSRDEKEKFIKRFTKKILQLINSSRVTVAAEANYRAILACRVAAYPEAITVKIKDSVPFGVPESGEQQADRSVAADFVKFCEVKSIENCVLYFEKKQFQLVEDDKLIKNLLKKYVAESKDEGDDKRKKRRKLRK